jgi:hypothetical protein
MTNHVIPAAPGYWWRDPSGKKHRVVGWECDDISSALPLVIKPDYAADVTYVAPPRRKPRIDPEEDGR